MNEEREKIIHIYVIHNWLFNECFFPVFAGVVVVFFVGPILLPARQRVKLIKQIYIRTHARTHIHRRKQFCCIARRNKNLKYFYNFLTIDYMIQNVAVCVRFIAPNSSFTAHLKYYILFYIILFSALTLSLLLCFSRVHTLPPSLCHTILTRCEVTRSINVSECAYTTHVWMV